MEGGRAKMDGGGDLDQPLSTGKEKAILIHAHRLKDKAEEEQTLEEMESKLKSRRSLCFHEYANSWYILEHTADGPKISKTFPDLPRELSQQTYIKYTSSAIVNSSLYVIGGKIHTRDGDSKFSNCIHYLDMNNSADGWKMSSIPFQFAGIPAKVVGNFICLLSKSKKIKSVDKTADECGLVYDTVKQVAYPFEPPYNCDWSHETRYVPLDGREQALVFPVLEQETGEERVYLHDPSQNSWEQLHDYSGNGVTYSHAVSNGILYSLHSYSEQKRTSIYSKTYESSDTILLSANDMSSGRKLFKKKLPQLSFSFHNMRLVPISDFMLCLLGVSGGALSYAKISVSLDPPAVRVVDERQLRFDDSKMVNCLPFDLDGCEHLKKQLSDDSASNTTDKKQKVLDLHWKRCCRHLLEENWRLQEEVRKLSKHPRTHLKINFAPVSKVAKEKSILIHVSRVIDPTLAHDREELELQLQQSRKLEFIENELQEAPDLPKTDSWFIIKHTAVGPQISEVFHNIPQDQSNIYCNGSSSVIVGNSLCVIGGRYNSPRYRLSRRVNKISNQIRHLDLKNLAQGWKTSKLPFYFADGSMEVTDNFIYMFPRFPFDFDECKEEAPLGMVGDKSQYPWGLIYDTIKQEARPLKLPQSYNNETAFGFHVEGRGVLVPLRESSPEEDTASLIEKEDSSFEQADVLLHDPLHNSWEMVDSYFDFPSGVTNYVVSKKILFLFKAPWNNILSRKTNMTLYAYEFNASSVNWLDFLFKIDLPPFNCSKSHCSTVSVVAVDDFTFCILGHQNCPESERPFNRGPLFYAKVLLTLDPHPSITILEETCFHMEAVEVVSCLPIDSSLFPK